jgi:hypothetical protein
MLALVSGSSFSGTARTQIAGLPMTAVRPRIHNIELAFVPFYASWLNRIEAQFQALRYFTLDGTDHPDHATQARMIRRYIAWRNRHAHDDRLRELVKRANVA